MAITPQAIKDQEFQTKFRGYDTVEVKAYLELIAEEFFELLEKLRQQEESLVEMARQKELDDEIATQLEDDLESSGRTIEELRATIADKDARQAELMKELEELQVAQEDFEQERKEYEEEISEAEAKVSERDDQLRQGRLEIDTLRNRIKLIEEQNSDLRKEEVDFKRTIGAAQRFADDLMERTRVETENLVQQSELRARELVRASEEKSARVLQIARDEIERLRHEAYEELSRLPNEIERLQEQRRQAREELRAVLSRHLDELDKYTVVDQDVVRYDYDELFQKIDIDEPLEAEKEHDFDGFDLDLPMPLADDELDDEDQDDLRKKLEEGGIAYLSDDE